MAESNPIGIKELIARIKAELLEEEDDTKPIFAIAQVELTIAFTAERNINGGINFHVVQTGGERKSSEVQTVTVALEPLVTVDEQRQSISPEQKEHARQRLNREFPSRRRTR